jgi:predicted acyl esterase
METIEQTLSIPVPGERQLHARLWRPKDGRHPAVIDYAPYRVGDLFAPLMESQLPVYAANGYAALAIDISGAGNSTGLLHDEYLPQEIGDLVETIAWASGQDWCDGQVALIGLSWAAFSALRAAAHKPPALKAMALGGVSEDGWLTDIHYLGGALYTGHVDWAGVMLMFNALPPDPAHFLGDWRTAWKARLEANKPWIIEWLSHPTHDAYWTSKAAPRDGETPLLLYSGWADKYATSVLRIAGAWRGPVRTIIGPWEHTPPDIATRGPRIGFLHEAIRWFDHHLKRADNGVMAEAPLRLWLASPDAQGEMTTGEWIATDWLMKPGPTARFAVHGETIVRDAETDDTLVILETKHASPPALPQDLYEDIPAPFNLKRAKELGAHITLSDPLAAELDIGAGSVVRCTTQVSLCPIFARLLDVAPDGTAIRMATGVFNLALSDNGSEIAISLQGTAWRVKRGHRLGLVLSNEAWPTFWLTRGGAGLAILSDITLGIPLASRHVETPRFTPEGCRA